MKGLTLRKYLDIRGITAADLSREIGRTRQNISNWIKDDATVEILDDGRIKVNTINVVHQPQVKS